jgi:mono/diheme cytochrome c family protein
MPPFSGTDEEREALAKYLSSLAPIKKQDLSTGEAVFRKYCATCHMKNMDDPLFGAFEGSPAEEIAPYFQDLKELNEVMPALHLSEKESDLLARFIVEFTQKQEQ